MSRLFPNLFSPFRLRGLEIRNRIFSTGHDTDLARAGVPGDELIAYHEARARGEVGLIIVQVVAVHSSALYTAEVLQGTDDDCIPHFRRLFDAIHAKGTAAFVQLFHPGREFAQRHDGVVRAAWGVSQSPAERFKVVPKAMSADEIAEITDGYGQTARRMAEAGADGVEIVCSHGYLPAQFLSPEANLRDDRYGGSVENRRRFLAETIASIRASVPGDLIVGARFSGDEFDPGGLDEEAMFEICRAFAPRLDYLNVIAGTSMSSGGAVHIVPPMSVSNAYMAPFAGKLKQACGGTAVFVAGRINQPQEAEAILQDAQADMCGMTRALISDPMMPKKAREDRVDDVRACIGCNQACIGHAQLGLPISCIQHPETGRERRFLEKPETRKARRILVVGGGPAGMKAASVAAEMGHDVTLWERANRLGGQALLAQLLPTRAEFGGIVDNLQRDARRAGAAVKKDSAFDEASCRAFAPDAVILATGSRRWMPPIEGGGIEILHHEEILWGAKTGRRVVVCDWRTDWIGIGVSEMLARAGAHVRLAVNGVCPGFTIQNYVRDAAIARLHRLQVETIPFARLYGAEDRTVFLLHTAAGEPIVMEDVDTLVVVPPNQPNGGQHPWLPESGIPYCVVGDALAPRTAEEAVYEGLTMTLELLGRFEAS